MAEFWVVVGSGGKDAPQKYKRFVYSCAGTLYGFDGLRLHWCSTMFPEGVYNPETWTLVNYEGFRPKWIEKLTKHLGALNPEDVLLDDLENEFEGIEGLDRVRTPIGGLFDARFVAEGVNGDLYPTFKTGIDRGRHVLYGENEIGGSYLIAGIKEIQK